MYVLEDLYYGNINPSERFHRVGSAYSAALSELAESEEHLVALLDEEQQSAYERYRDRQMDIMAMGDFHAFEQGFRLGMRLALDVFLPASEREVP